MTIIIKDLDLDQKRDMFGLEANGNGMDSRFRAGFSVRLMRPVLRASCLGGSRGS